MPLRTGTNTLDTLLQNDSQRLAELEQRAIDAIAVAILRRLQIWSAILAEQMGEFAEITTDRQRVDAGFEEIGEGVRLTETGRAPTQTTEAPYVTLGFQLDGWQYSIGWTQRALDQSTPADLARQEQAAEAWHAGKITADLRRALYGATNFSVRDRLLKDKINLDVKRFYNADGWPIPMNANGVSFDGAVHTHYLAGALDGAMAAALVDTVREHRLGAAVRIIIAQEDEAMWTALPNFKPFQEPGIVRASGELVGPDLDIDRPDNRPIGRINGATVWVKPWAIADYAVAYLVDGPRPLVLRVPPARGGMPSLRLAATNRAYPLIADFMETEYGFSAGNRAGAAILYTGGGTVYVEPTING